MKLSGSMLRRKMIRDIIKNKSQFITILLMIMIGVMVYTGVEAYMDGMRYTADKFYTDNNLEDLNVLGSFSNADLDKIKNLENVNDVEGKYVINMSDLKDEDKSYQVSFISSNKISKFYVEDGIEFSKDKKGVWIDYFYALENNLNVGDKISFKYDDYVFNEEILGLIYVPDNVYDVKDASQIMPNHKTYGFVYMSICELEDYFKSKMNTDNFNYLDYIHYNYIMVDVNKKSNVDAVKNQIDNFINTLSTLKIEDSSSYKMYQGEIDEGEAYVGIFSGLFLFIALLSVVTTMSRVVKNQKLQIGTLKALGFSKARIAIHYISYGFYVSILGCVLGILLGRYFLGVMFLNLEMSFFEMPNGTVFINNSTYLVCLFTVLIVCLITFVTCFKELRKRPVDSLKISLPSVNNKHLNITTKGLFKKLSFSSKWNLRDILRNKFRTITGIIGIAGCCTLIVCAFGMLNSMNYFIKVQFDDLYNFNYKLSLKDDVSNIDDLINKYGDNTSETLVIEVKGDSSFNSLFVDKSNNYVRFIDDNYNFIKLSNDDGVYVTYKYKESHNLKIGDTVSWHMAGDKKYYNSKIVGFYKDPQVQGLATSYKYLERIGINYKPDTIYTNKLIKNKNIEGVSAIQNIDDLKDSINSMLSMMREMIVIIIVFAVILGVVIIYNMSILSFSEKVYQFATLKVLGFSDKKIKKIFMKQNSIITIVSIIIGLPAGYFLVSYLFNACLDENYDFGVYIEIWSYVLAALGSYLVSYLVSKYLTRKVNSIDMVSSLKSNE